MNKRASLKKIEKTSISPNFNMELFLTSKLILKGSYAFALFLKWISLQMKNIYKMSILEEIILVLILGIKNKQFSTKFNRNKHERIKGHFHRDARPVREIPFNDATKVYMWDFRWNSYGYLGSSSTARVTIFQRELFETLSLTKHFLQKIRCIAYVCYHNTWRSTWYLCENTQEYVIICENL